MLAGQMGWTGHAGHVGSAKLEGWAKLGWTCWAGIGAPLHVAPKTPPKPRTRMQTARANDYVTVVVVVVGSGIEC